MRGGVPDMHGVGGSSWRNQPSGKNPAGQRLRSGGHAEDLAFGKDCKAIPRSIGISPR